MKCEKCGKNEANYYYSSNINGNVTEKHLCSECAREFENSGDYMNTKNMFVDMENMFSGLFGRDRFLSGWDDFGFRMPTMLLPRINIMLGAHPSATESAPASAPEVSHSDQPVDPEMSRRRQLNELRNQMEAAAREENYEKAIELREKIKELENGEEKAE